MGRLMFISSEIDNAAREGAQIAAMNPRILMTGPNGLATQVVSKMVVTDRSTIGVSRACSGTGCGTCAFCKVQVTVSAPWRTLVPILDWGNLAMLHATSSKLVEAANPTPAPTPTP